MFGGGGSIQLARISGIRIGVDTSWFIVLFLIIWSLGSGYQDVYSSTTAYLLSVTVALLFFLSILLHELGHAFAARRDGIGIQGIDLWMFGGVAKMDRDAATAGEEFRVAVAGPVVTLLIAIATTIAWFAIGTPGDTQPISLAVESTDPAHDILGYVATVNVAILAFNLLPGFPLDGGRIARAAIWWRTGDRNRATRQAAQLGRGVAYLTIGGGVFVMLSLGAVFTGIWFVFIGVMLSQAARQAEVASHLSERLGALLVSDVMDAEPVAIPGDLSLDRAEEEFFLRYRYPWFPVVDESQRFIGLVTQSSVEGLPEAIRPGRTVSSVMASDAGDGESLMRVAADAPLEALLGLESLARLGAIMAVDGDGRLRGIVTLDAVNRALQPARTA
jgi:Zn-dependent protease